MSDPIILENLQLILESIDLINRRFSKLSRPDEFVSDDNGILILDSITMRLQVIGELLKKIDKREGSFLKSYQQINWDKGYCIPPL